MLFSSAARRLPCAAARQSGPESAVDLVNLLLRRVRLRARGTGSESGKSENQSQNEIVLMCRK